MIRTYDTGLEANRINFEAKVGTTGVAYTSVYLRKDGLKPKKILESNASSGNIPETFIAKAAKLKSYYLMITVRIDFSAFEQTMWEQLKNNATTTFTLKGGFSGVQNYKHEKEDIQVFNGGENIAIDILIQLL
jgi:hypothetical protein